MDPATDESERRIKNARALRAEAKEQIELLQAALKDANVENARLGRKVEKLQSLTTTDALTGVKNRLGIDQALKGYVASTDRYKTPMSVIIFDLDHFKAINDTHGHEMGDIVLKRVGQILQKVARANDFAGRYGGEEFLVITQGGSEAALALAERLRAEIEAQTYSPAIDVTASFGICEFRPGREMTLVRDADKAMYAAKEQGRNRIVILDPKETW